MTETIIAETQQFYITRNADIVRRYLNGESQVALARAYGIKRQRVQQILRKAGISKDDSPTASRGNRYAFIGSNVTEATRAALKTLAEQRHTTLSRIIADLVEDELRKTG